MLSPKKFVEGGKFFADSYIVPCPSGNLSSIKQSRDENDSMIFIPRISRFGCKAGTSINHEAWTRQQMGKICRFEASAKCSIIDSMELEE